MMIQSIRTGKWSKVFACYLSMQIILQIIQPTAMWALTGGPKQPEFNSFTPIGTSDMVDLASGDFNYNIPIMDVGGYPLNLSYQSGITMDQEASWVGLGWNLNVGQINRNVRGIPDDFKGDEMITENNLRDNVTVTAGATVDAQIFGLELPDLIKNRAGLSVGASLTYNNYTGVSFTPSLGLSFSLNDNTSVGMRLNGSSTEGATVAPYVNLKTSPFFDDALTANLNAGISYNSRHGLTSFNLAVSLNARQNTSFFSLNKSGRLINVDKGGGGSLLGGSGSISFANTTLTPRKRTAYRENTGTFSASFGGDIWGGDGELEGSASAGIQRVLHPIKIDKAYGYDFTGFANHDDLLDYNRENDQLISKTTLALPVTNYTYDVYSVQAQGFGGMFRPYRSQVGQINDEYVADVNESFSFGAEIEPGTGFHVGANFTKVKLTSSTGVWETPILRHFKQKSEDKKTGDYEPVYYKYVGENHVDKDYDLFNKLGGYNPVAIKLGGSGFDTYADSKFKIKEYNDKVIVNGKELNSVTEYRDEPFSESFDRDYRVLRNQNILKISKEELINHYKAGSYIDHWNERNPYAKDHHTAEIRLQNTQGSTYVFGEPAYNKLKEEVSFTTDNSGDCSTGILTYRSGENSNNNRSGKDNFYNKVATPSYAHSYLLSSILSTDYEDLTGNGPSDDDLGSYTKFDYEKKNNTDYKWRVPFGAMEASYDAGLNTDKADQKGSYVYGEKEIKYIKTIETKTHIAVFTTSERKDGKGVASYNGGYKSGDSQSMYKLDKIELYSKPEYLKAKDDNSLVASPIKTAHFKYNYDLCTNIENHQDYNTTTKQGPGKLTLEKVFFTYRDSKMGAFTPYKFNYDGFNPSYNLKGYDIWGNYKPNGGGCNTKDEITAPEFPFVQQDDKILQDEYASAWSLTSIDLPSGGRIDLEYETDDYQYVQDRHVMQMFKIVGAGNSNPIKNDQSVFNTKMYTNSTGGDVSHLYVKLPVSVDSAEEFEEKYLRKIKSNPIYFRFFMNMTKHGSGFNSGSQDYDYVTGYFNIDNGQDINIFDYQSEKYAAIPMESVKLEGGISGGNPINPITKAGLYFARRYLNAQSLGLEPDYRKQDVKTIINEIVASFNSFRGLFTGPNQELRKPDYGVAKRFVPEKSWIRLTTPRPNKLGGGVRVKKLQMHDNWNEMLSANEERYNNTYGQEYDYRLKDGTTSGVATFEPNRSKENPFVEPFYNDGDRLVAPKELSYIEKPFGASFFPAAKVTYGRVTVANLAKPGVNKHATGRVVTEHFTSKDFPTKVDHTDIDNRLNVIEDSVLGQALKSAVGASIRNEKKYTLSQGFMIHTNDMDGKVASQTVYPEGSDTPISSVINKYNTKPDAENELSNKVTVIGADGKIKKEQSIGVDYDVVLDFRQSFSNTETSGVKANLVILALPCVPVVLVPVATVFPVDITHNNIAHSVITTKVIHTTAIMKEKIATDLGATVTTTNEAWDENTGQILLTKTVNEFNDQYYNFNFPAYWRYKNMGMASTNTGIEGTLVKTGSDGYFQYNSPGSKAEHFVLGDEILGKYNNRTERFWVVGKQNKNVLLMNRQGNVINKSADDSNNFVNIDVPIRFKIVRSGYRNLQHVNMGSITMQKNPLANITNITDDTFKQEETSEKALAIVNASAVSYSELWNPQCERGLPSRVALADSPNTLESIGIHQYGFNPYLFNAKGEWRADKSYAYLTERNQLNTTEDKVSIRKEGFFKEFTPYYINESGNWIENAEATNKWTFASEVTQYSPYGAELENKDALERFSSAQYGYHYTLPTAVASNSRYRYMGADNMEDYSFPTALPRGLVAPKEAIENSSEQEHFNFKEATMADGDSGIEISNEVAHTGRNSLLVPSNDFAELQRPLKGELEAEDLDSDGDGYSDAIDTCPFTYNRSDQFNDHDEDGVADACDDHTRPRILNLQQINKNVRPPDYRGGLECHARRALFELAGKPNSTVYYKIEKGDNSWYVRVNKEVVASDHNHGKVLELKLDVTGRLCVTFDFVNISKSKRWAGATFVLLDRDKKTELGRIYETSKRYKRCHGDPTPLRCD